MSVTDHDQTIMPIHNYSISNMKHTIVAHVDNIAYISRAKLLKYKIKGYRSIYFQNI